MPAVISGSLLAFAMSMDDVVISIFVNGAADIHASHKSLYADETGVTPEINALCTIMLGLILIVLVMYSLVSKRHGKKMSFSRKEK